MSQLILGHSRPEPMSEDDERNVRAELRSIDSLLDLRFVPNVYAGKTGDEGRYALICRWPQSDKRWELFQRGELGEAFDILGWYTTDVHSANSVPTRPDEVWELTHRLLASADNDLLPWRKRLANAAQANIDLKKKRRQDFLDGEGHELIAESRREAYNTQTVSVGVDIKSMNGER